MKKADAESLMTLEAAARMAMVGELAQIGRVRPHNATQGPLGGLLRKNGPAPQGVDPLSDLQLLPMRLRAVS